MYRLKQASFWLYAVLPFLAISLILALLCAWAAGGFMQPGGWFPFWLMSAAGCGILLLSWRLLRGEIPPRWLFVLAAGAAVLRLATGAFWTTALPVWGYGSPVEKAGYVMKDAWVRDTAAWDLGQSAKPVWKAFTQKKWADQYGGLLFISVLIYRYFGGGVHQPLLIVMLCAAAGGAAVLFTWAFSRRVWGEGAAVIGAWIAALYPEAVLMGSSQMREALMIPLAALAFYGAVHYTRQRTWMGPVCTLASLLGCVLISPPFAGLILLGLLAFVFVIARQEMAARRLLSRKVFWLAIIFMIVLVGVGLWFAWVRIVPADVHTPWDTLNWIARKTATYQTYLSRQSSGWLQREFRKLPEVFHLPMLIGYGALRPFLPAALAAFRSPLWYGVSVWRSAGWALLLLSLVAATLRLLAGGKDGKRDGVSLVLCVVVWVGILTAAARGGGDDWDNPRYRTVFFCLQAGLAGWFWAEARRFSSVTVRRVIVMTCIFLFWFLAWYLRRYQGFPWAIVSIFHTIGLAVAASVLYLIWDVARAAPQGR